MNVKRIAISMIAAALALGVLLPTAASAEGNGGSVEIQSRLTTPKQVRHPAEGGTWTYGNYRDVKVTPTMTTPVPTMRAAASSTGPSTRASARHLATRPTRKSIAQSIIPGRSMSIGTSSVSCQSLMGPRALSSRPHFIMNWKWFSHEAMACSHLLLCVCNSAVYMLGAGRARDAKTHPIRHRRGFQSQYRLIHNT